MPRSAVLPCEEDEESPELSQLRHIVLEFDDLWDLCMMTRLSLKDQVRLDSLYAYLMLEERKYWEGVPDTMVQMLQDHSSLDFPMIRYNLGMTPITE